MINKIKNYTRKTIYPEGVTPLPAGIMSILFCIMLINGMISTSCFPYLPKMVKSFGISEVDAGYYSGLISTSLYLGYIMLSALWGHFGDTKGNKLAVMLSISGMTVATLSFGFSTSYYWALISRILQGCFMGYNVVCKTILADNLDETNISLGFSIFYTCWTFAFIIGPSASGFLVFPAEQYPEIFSKDSIFGQYAVLLPNLIIAIFDLILLVATFIFIPNDKRTKTEEEQSLLADSNLPKQMEDSDQKKILSEKIKDNTTKTINEKSLSSQPKSQKNDHFHKTLWERIMLLLHLKDYVIAVIAYAFLGFSIIGIEEMFPLFASTSKDYHGLNYNTSQIGTVILISSIFLLLVQIFVISRITHRYGGRKTFIGCALLPVFSFSVLPAISCITNSLLQQVCAVILTLMNQVSVNGTLLTINILLNNLVTSDLYGSSNGIAQTMTGFGRILAPSVFGTLFTWSLKNVKGIVGNNDPWGFPFNQFFVFYLCASTFILCAYLVSFISTGEDRK